MGMHIAAYEDEKEGFELSRSLSKPQTAAPEPAPESEAERDAEKESESDKDIEKETDGDVESAKPPAATPPDANIVEFTGTDDMDNPQNWSTLKKCFVFAQICLLTFTSKSMRQL